MKYREIIKSIKNINWYRQGGALRLFYCFRPYHCVNETIGYDRNIIFQKGDNNTAFFDKTRQTAKAWWVIGRQEKNRRFIDHWIKGWEKKQMVSLRLCAEYFKIPVENWSDQELIYFVRKYNNLALEQWKKGVLMEWFDPEGELILHKLIKKYGVGFTKEGIEILISPRQLTFVQQEFLARLALIQKFRKGKNINADIHKHTKNFYWYKNTWAYVYELDEKYFFQLIKSEIKDLPKLIKEAKQIKKHLSAIKAARVRLMKIKKIPKGLRNIFYLFSKMADWRDYRKETSVCMANHYLYQILKRLAVVNKLPLELVSFATPAEITGWKLSSTLVNELRKRQKGAIYLCSAKKQCQWIYSRKAYDLFNLLNKRMRTDVIKGYVAQKGVIKGRVKIIETASDFSKMRKGNILVAQMTRPEYVPVIKLARAIVTDEGGLTCHAAIISREMKIPCVIGTQTATSVLKDGDIVEVNANKGIVRIL
ncbi:MAG: PEP-utilizing enzyme [Patescibacteria group bacterium]